MKIVQSLWTGTPMFSAQRHLLMLHTLSLCMALRYHAEVEFVTDDQGLEIAEFLGWRYTSYSNCLDELTRGGVTHVWALGKMAAILRQARPFLHIDNDVLLFGSVPGRLMRARLVAERVDFPTFYRSQEALVAIEVAGLSADVVPYNCGVVGGTDIFLLQRYARRALELADRFYETALNGTACSIVVEQYWLGQFAREQGVRVETVLPAAATTEDARKARYLHLWGGKKREPEVVAKVEGRLMREFPAEYAAFCSGWKRMEREGRTSPSESYY